MYSDKDIFDTVKNKLYPKKKIIRSFKNMNTHGEI